MAAISDRDWVMGGAWVGSLEVAILKFQSQSHIQPHRDAHRPSYGLLSPYKLHNTLRKVEWVLATFGLVV